MSTPEGDYQVLDRTQLTKWDNPTQTAIEGWQVRARWNRTATVLTVFVPLETYNATNVDAAIRTAGYADESIAALGGAGG